MEITPLTQKLFETTAKIPRGKVLTYGLLAKLSGVKSPRVVGSMLHKNKNPQEVPCHRVVNREGKVAEKFGMGGASVQVQRLRSEGVEITEGKVNLEKHLWQCEF